MIQRATTIVGSPTRACASLVGQLLVLRVRLTRKLADRLNGLDLSKVRVGDCLDLAPKEARMLLAEGWAEPVEGSSQQALEA